jgi:outer membrane lipoprotein-sorting protein
MFNKIILLAMIFSFHSSYAEQATLSSLMKAIKSQEATRIAYEEVKTLELMDEPWEGSGFMYSLPPDLMVKEQLLPKRIVMGVKGDKMFYLDQGNNIRHQGELDSHDLMSLNVAVFKSLINADEKLLNTMYEVDFKHSATGWLMNLKPKNGQHTTFSTQVSGVSMKHIDKIIIKQADGDSSEFTLHQDASGYRIKNIVKHLYQELQGE